MSPEPVGQQAGTARGGSGDRPGTPPPCRDGAARELFVLLAWVGVVELRATSLHVGDATNATTLAAERVFGISDVMTSGADPLSSHRTNR